MNSPCLARCLTWTLPHRDALSLTPTLDPMNQQANPREGQSPGVPSGSLGPRPAEPPWRTLEPFHVPAGPAPTQPWLRFPAV